MKFEKKTKKGKRKSCSFLKQHRFRRQHNRKKKIWRRWIEKKRDLTQQFHFFKQNELNDVNLIRTP